jgi:hypothetical protein
MIVLDTNVISELMHKITDTRVVNWLDGQPRTSVWTTSVTVMEIRYGLQILPEGKRRTLMTVTFEKILTDHLEGRIAAFDSAAAERAGELMALRHKKGRHVEVRDAMIAAIILDRNATFATRNTVHFDDLSVPVINPWLGKDS